MKRLLLLWHWYWVGHYVNVWYTIQKDNSEKYSFRRKMDYHMEMYFSYSHYFEVRKKKK